jgi:hypothetical protein
MVVLVIEDVVGVSVICIGTNDLVALGVLRIEGGTSEGRCTGAIVGGSRSVIHLLAYVNRHASDRAIDTEKPCIAIRAARWLISDVVVPGSHWTDSPLRWSRVSGVRCSSIKNFIHDGLVASITRPIVIVTVVEVASEHTHTHGMIGE